MPAQGAEGADAAGSMPEGVSINGPVRDEARGVDVFMVASPYTGKTNHVDVLLPSRLEPGRKYPVLYVLPVGGEWSAKPQWGNGLDEARKAGVADRYGLICVGMEFDTIPWFGAHATDPHIRHEEYLRKVVVPLVESRYPASAQAKDRLLLGFSKSGWGAVTLLLRNADFYGAACSWDAPLCFTQQDFGKVGTRAHYGTAEQMASYLPLKLAEVHAAEFLGGPVRLTILGRKIWWNHSAQFAKRLQALSIPHRFSDALEAEHTWTSGWLPEALRMFLQDRAPVPAEAKQ